jgi:hypothetical protein
MREILLERNNESVATVKETIGDRFDSEFISAEVDFAEAADDGDRERIVRTARSKHFKNNFDGKTSQVFPGTISHFELLPSIFIRMGYQVRVIGSIDPR